MLIVRFRKSYLIEESCTSCPKVHSNEYTANSCSDRNHARMRFFYLHWSKCFAVKLLHHQRSFWLILHMNILLFRPHFSFLLLHVKQMLLYFYNHYLSLLCPHVCNNRSLAHDKAQILSDQTHRLVSLMLHNIGPISYHNKPIRSSTWSSMALL